MVRIVLIPADVVLIGNWILDSFPKYRNSSKIRLSIGTGQFYSNWVVLQLTRLKLNETKSNTLYYRLTSFNLFSMSQKPLRSFLRSLFNLSNFMMPFPPFLGMTID